MTPEKSPLPLWLIAIGGLIAVGSAAFGLYVGNSIPEQPATKATVTRSGPDRRDFALVDTDGKPATLANFQGKWVLMFFGFTNCPDVCPTAMINLGNTLKAMGDGAKDVQPVFITIDPERDTPEVLKSYLGNFDAQVIGLTGSAQQIADVARAYPTFYQKHALGDGNYTMDHSSAFQLISPTGEYLRAFRPDDEPDEFAKELLAAMGKEPRT